MENKQWELKSHSYQIADTGDYDGYWELTNGDICLITKDEIDVDEEMRAVNPETEDTNAKCVDVLVSCLNQLECKWEDWKLSDKEFELHLEQENCKKWKEIARDLYEAIDTGGAATYIVVTKYLEAVDNI